MSAALVVIAMGFAFAAQDVAPLPPPDPIDAPDAPHAPDAPAAPAAPDAPPRKRARPVVDDASVDAPIDDRPERMLRGALAGGLGAAAGAAALATVLYVEAAAPGHIHEGALLAAAAAAPGVAALAGGSLAIAFGMHAPTGNDFAWVWACTGLGYVAAVAIIVLVVAAPVGGSCLSGFLGCGQGCGGPSPATPAAAEPADIPRAPLIVAGATAAISAAGMAIAGAAYWGDGTSSRFLAAAATGAIVGAAVGGTLGGAAVGALSP